MPAQLQAMERADLLRALMTGRLAGAAAGGDAGSAAGSAAAGGEGDEKGSGAPAAAAAPWRRLSDVLEVAALLGLEGEETEMQVRRRPPAAASVAHAHSLPVGAPLGRWSRVHSRVWC